MLEHQTGPRVARRYDVVRRTQGLSPFRIHDWSPNSDLLITAYRRAVDFCPMQLKQNLARLRADASGLRLALRGLYRWNKSVGFLASARLRSPARSSTEPLPWFSYPAIEFIEGADFSQYDVFEWGSGFSTLYWASRARSVTAIEDDRDWFQRIDQLRVGWNGAVTLGFESEQDRYVEAYLPGEQDVVVIDGSWRGLCARHVIDSVAGGLDDRLRLVILDNSNWFPQASRALENSLQWQRVDFCGMAPALDYGTVTSMFFNRNSILSHRRAPSTWSADPSVAVDDLAPYESGSR